MALNMYTNMYSVTAQTNLTIANSSLTRSIERLSSGLRINHASDDASGLSISEKLRGQIKGLAKASMNAQDAISFLQTAEGGIEVISDMLQRMRELAIQAGNGTYTANDRRELQKEVDQLKAEVDRISSSTEFNTKKLLTGQSSGLWSSDSGNIDVVMKGAPAEGNYKLTFNTIPGTNAVYKTDIMTVKSDTLIEKALSNGTSLRSFAATGDVVSLDETRLDFKTFEPNPGPYPSADMQAVYQRQPVASNGYQYSGAGTFTVDMSATVTGTPVSTGYIAVEFLSDQTVVLSGSISNVRVTFIDATTGTSYDKTQTLYDATGAVATGKFVMDNGMTITLSMNNNSATTSVGKQITAGDKVLLTLQGDNPTGADAATDIRVRATVATDATDVSLIGAEASYGGGTVAGVIGSPSVVIKNGKTTGGEITTVTINNGKFEVATVRWDKDYNVAGFISGSVTLDAFKAGTVGAGGVKLKDIGLFTNADGRMVLDNTQYLDVYANNKMASITLEGEDTINDLVNKLRSALSELNVAGDMQLSDLIHYVEPGEQNPNGGNFAVPGTMIMQTALMGNASELRFVADEGVLNALSVLQIQESKNSEMTVSVSDAHTGEFIGKDVVSDSRLRNVIKGVDVIIAPNVGTNAQFVAGKVVFSADTSQEVFLHIVGKSTKVQVGASEGQTFDVSIARLDTIGLEIGDAYVTTMEESQKAITKFDQALEAANHARATIGAQINRLEYSMKNISISRQNLMAAESRIRDLDVADESATFAKSQILVNAAVAMLAQANQLPQTALSLIGR
ncbi:flagellin [Deferribacterales bacterium RsTz2092]|nr:flagellin [Deferribacterales bacterium]